MIEENATDKLFDSLFGSPVDRESNIRGFAEALRKERARQARENRGAQTKNTAQRPENHKRKITLHDSFGDDTTPEKLMLTHAEQQELLAWLRSIPEPPGLLYLYRVTLKK